MSRGPRKYPPPARCWWIPAVVTRWESSGGGRPVLVVAAGLWRDGVGGGARTPAAAEPLRAVAGRDCAVQCPERGAHPVTGDVDGRPGVNGQPEQAGYRCEALAEGLVYGTGQTARYVLGTFRTISPVLALRWLGGQALWIVDRLGLDPYLGHLAELRAWYEDRESQRAAHAQIKTGAPLLVVVPDTDCTYTLSVRSVEQAPATAFRHHPGEGSRPRIAHCTRYGPRTAAAPCGTCGG